MSFDWLFTNDVKIINVVVQIFREKYGNFFALEAPYLVADRGPPARTQRARPSPERLLPHRNQATIAMDIAASLHDYDCYRGMVLCLVSNHHRAISEDAWAGRAYSGFQSSRMHQTATPARSQTEKPMRMVS